MSQENVIKFSDITFRRGQSIIIDGLNWEVQKGDHWVIFGANGSGKTTLLNLLTGYLWPTNGIIRVLGEQFGRVDLREFRKKFGWVSSALNMMVQPQSKGIDIVLSGYTATLGVKEDYDDNQIQKAGEVLDFLKCRYLADRYYGVMSQGERQKIMIARALVTMPEILILDEACAGLDLAARENILNTIYSLMKNQNSPTILFVTHHIDEIHPEFNKTLLLKGGRELSSGDTDSVITSESISSAFDIPLTVERHNNRFVVKFKKKKPRINGALIILLK